MLRPYRSTTVANDPQALALAVYLGNQAEPVKVAAIRRAYAPMATFVAAMIAEAEGCETMPISSSFRVAVTLAA